MSADRDCTCLGACRGAGSLAPGWRCALARIADSVDVSQLRELRRDNHAPVITAALAFHASTHTHDAHCRAGDHDNCTRPAAERALDAAVAAYLGGE